MIELDEIKKINPQVTISTMTISFNLSCKIDTLNIKDINNKVYDKFLISSTEKKNKIKFNIKSKENNTKIIINIYKDKFKIMGCNNLNQLNYNLNTFLNILNHFSIIEDIPENVTILNLNIELINSTFKVNHQLDLEKFYSHLLNYSKFLLNKTEIYPNGFKLIFNDMETFIYKNGTIVIFSTKSVNQINIFYQKFMDIYTRYLFLNNILE